MPLLRSMAGSLSSFWLRGAPVERAGYVIGALLLMSGLMHLAILVIGGGSWDGPLSLRKPSTFGLSFGLTLTTIVWVASFLRLRARAKTVLLGTFTVACVIETALVSLQAWRGVPSHFNIGTPFDALVARTLAAGGLALIVTVAGLSITAFRANPRIPASLRVAIQVGFIALFCALLVGASMIAKGMQLVFAGDPQAAYATGGTLKPTHAVAMHVILLLPAQAWVLSFAGWSERRRLGLVLLAAAGYAGLTLVVALGNLMGMGLDRTPIVVVAALAALALLASGLLTLAGVAGSPTTDGIRHGRTRRNFPPVQP
jgi:hypothetical protein